MDPNMETLTLVQLEFICRMAVDGMAMLADETEKSVLHGNLDVAQEYARARAAARQEFNDGCAAYYRLSGRCLSL